MRFVHEKLEREAASLAAGNLGGSDLRPDLALADVRLGEIARGVLERVRAQPPAVDTGQAKKVGRGVQFVEIATDGPGFTVDDNQPNA